MGGLDFGGAQPHALCREDTTIEGYLRLTDPALWAVEDNAILACHLYELQEVSVMLLRGMAIGAYVVIYHNYAREDSPLLGPSASGRCPGTSSG